MDRSISIRGARTHNLADISLEIPREKLTVVTGVSGSGKSSLVFDTVYAEGQRRYVQSLSTYARLFLERMERPDVDSISEIPPALALRQKNTIKNARSTVGTVTEISDYLRLLFATVGHTVCPKCGGEVSRDSVENAGARILEAPGLYVILAPFEAGSRSIPDAAGYLIQNGYHRLYANDAITETAEFAARAIAAEAQNGTAQQPQPTPDNTMMVVVDRISVNGEGEIERVREALEKAFYLGAGRARAVRVERDNGNTHSVGAIDFDRRFNCSRCATAFAEPTTALFSSNSPIGACPECEGFGRTVELDLDKVIPDHTRSMRNGLVAPWRTPAYREMNDWMLKLARRRKIRTSAPFREMTDEERTWLLDGDEGPRAKWDEDKWPGVHGFFKWLEGRRYKTHVRILLAKYRRFVTCPACGGAKLKAEALNVLVDGKSIADVGRLSIRDLVTWLDKIETIPEVATRAAVVMRELRNRVSYLVEVGLGYLTVERQARTLSGGEAQRIHLASALGSVLVGTLYALDEPTVGLHAADARRLLAVLYSLRDFGNTVVVVEHDPAMIAGADHVVELGPGGGSEGGELTYSGPPAKATLDSMASSPGRVLLMRALAKRRKFTKHDPAIRIIGASEHNLAGIDVALPAGRMICVTGVSGSGKSTLVEDVLYNNYLRRSGNTSAEPGECERIDGLELIGEMVHMGQELPTRSMRSNPATYLKIYDDIRKLFAASPEARRLGRAGAAFFVQRHGRAMRKVQRHRHRHHRDAFHGGPRSEMRRVRRPPLPEPYSRDQAAQLQHQPGARSHGRGRARVFHPSSGDRQAARRADRGRPRLHPARADDLDAVRRRGATPQARALSAGRSRTRAGWRRREASAADVHPRRADHRPQLDRHQAPDQSAQPAGDRGQHAGGDRAQPRVHRERRLCH